MISIENFQSLMQKYESTIREISQELDDYQEEQNFIKNQIDELVKENQELSSELNNELTKKNAGDTTTVTPQRDLLIQNLRQQLELISNEKAEALKLWQNATVAIENLEEQLGHYQDINQLVPKSEIAKIKASYEEKIKLLEADLAETRIKIQETINQTQAKNKENESEEKYQSQSMNIVKNLEEEILNLQQRLITSERIQNQLQTNLEDKISEIELLKVANKECCLKVEEALDVADKALQERNESIQKEKNALAEVARITKLSTEQSVLNEENTRKELEVMKVEYESKIEKLHNDLKHNQEIMEKKIDQMQKYAAQTFDQEVQMSSDSTKNSKLLILEKNYEKTFQDLVLSEKEKIQAQAERESIKHDLTQMASHYKRDINTREAEKLSLKNEIFRLQTLLTENEGLLDENSKELDKIKLELSNMKLNYEQKLKEESESIRQKYKTEIARIEAIHKEVTENLNNQISSHIEMNNKWKTESKTITNQFEKRLNEMKIEMNKMKADNKNVYEKLQESNSRIFEYKRFLQLLAKDVNKITSVSTPNLLLHEKSVEFQ